MKKNRIDSRITNSPCVSTESRPFRGAKNRIQGRSSASADFLLEAEKRGSPPKSEKVAAFWRVGGAGRGVQPFLREDSSESNADSPLRHSDLYNLDSRVLDSSLVSLAQNDEKLNVCTEASCDKSQTKFIESNIRGSSLRGFRGFSSARLRDKTRASIEQSSAMNPAKAPKIQREVMTNARSAFGMMFAIIITILVATLGVLAVKFSAKTLNTTTNEYIAIQLDLYLNSTAELAILYVQRNGFVCEENAANCDVGEAGNADRRPDATAPIEKYISYGANSEYKFKYKMTPLANYDGYNPDIYTQPNTQTGECIGTDTKPCFKEETKNAFILDISGSVTNPLTNQTLRVTKRQIIKP